GPLAAELRAAHLAESADWNRRLRAVDPRARGGAAVCRRLPACPHADEPRRPRGTLEHAHHVPATPQLTPMEISASYTFAASSDRVWNLLMDPAMIASCIPGCGRFEPDGDDRYRVQLVVALAAITGTYEGTV